MQIHEQEEAVEALTLLADWLTVMYNEGDSTSSELALLKLNGDAIAMLALALKKASIR